MAGSTRNNPFEIDPSIVSRKSKETADLSLDRFEVVRFVAQVGRIVVVRATSHGPRIVVSFTLVVFHPSNSGKQHRFDHIGLPYEWRHYFKRVSVAHLIRSLLFNLKAEFIELLCLNGGGRVAHEIDGAGRLGEGDDLADIRLPRHQRHDAIESQRNSAVRRRAVIERVEE